jgi:uncharacterized membrane protein
MGFDLIIGVWTMGIQSILGARSLAEWRKGVKKSEQKALSQAERNAATIKFVSVCVVGLVGAAVVYRVAVK